MAQVAHPLQKQPETDSEWVDRWLYLAFADWSDFSNFNDDPAGWDEEERYFGFDQIVEWPLVRGRLAKLSEIAAEGRMTPEQRTRHDELLKLVEVNKPKLERLANGPLPLST